MEQEKIENIPSSHFSSLREGSGIAGICQELRDLAEKSKSKEAVKKYIKDLENLNAHLEDLNVQKNSRIAILSHDLKSPSLPRKIESRNQVQPLIFPPTNSKLNFNIL